MIDYERPDPAAQFPENATLAAIAEKLDALIDATRREELPNPSVFSVGGGDIWRTTVRMRGVSLLLSSNATADNVFLNVGTAARIRLNVTAGMPVSLDLPLIYDAGVDISVTVDGGSLVYAYIVAYPEQDRKGP